MREYKKLRVIQEIGLGKTRYVSIPKEFSNKLGLKGGDYVEMILKDNVIILKPIKID